MNRNHHWFLDDVFDLPNSKFRILLGAFLENIFSVTKCLATDAGAIRMRCLGDGSEF